MQRKVHVPRPDAPISAGISNSFSMALATFAALLSVMTFMFMRSPPSPPSSPPIMQCKWGGFLRLQCKGVYCTRHAGQCVPAGTNIPGAPSFFASATAHKADTLIVRGHRSVKSCLEAADLYEKAAMSSTGASAAELRLKAGDALNCAMRIQGTGNIILLQGTLDTPANKKFWGVHGPRALALIKEARAAHAPFQSDASAAAMEMDAFMYSSSSKGILRQALTGAGATFKNLAEELTNMYTSWDGHVGHCYLGGFYAVAPWPLGDKRRGLAEFNAAFIADPRARRNGYYACLLRYQHGDHHGAVSACETALNRGQCEGPTTPDYCEFLTQQVRKVLALAKAQGRA